MNTIIVPNTTASLKSGELLLNKELHTWITNKEYKSADLAVLLTSGDTSTIRIKFYTEMTGKSSFSTKNASTTRFSLRSKGSLMSTDQTVEFSSTVKGDTLTLTPMKPTN